MGHNVTAIDVDADRVAKVNRGKAPIYEPGLDDLLRAGVEAGRITAVQGTPEHLDAEFVFLAVGTPPSTGGASDLRAVRDAVTSLAPVLRPDAVIVNKSTVPIGTGDLVAQIARHYGAPSLAVVSNPEFLQEGTAIHNFMHPDRVVLGSAEPKARERVAALFEPLDAPIVLTGLRTAEMIKYASNAFLATKVSFVNEMASICEVVGADIEEVARGMGLDERIGRHYMRAGIGWGGSCFPKDVASLEHTASTFGAHPQLLRHVIEINREQRRRVLSKVREALGSLEGRRILVLGAAFKPHTDDIRESPALEVADLMQLAGAEVVVHDPHVSRQTVTAAFPALDVSEDLLRGAAGADALVLATEWPEFLDLPLADLAEVMRRRLIVDGRNVLDAAGIRDAGFAYRCVGRPALEGDPAGALDAVEEPGRATVAAGVAGAL